jgi:hypothetical protein
MAAISTVASSMSSTRWTSARLTAQWRRADVGIAFVEAAGGDDVDRVTGEVRQSVLESDEVEPANWSARTRRGSRCRSQHWRRLGLPSQSLRSRPHDADARAPRSRHGAGARPSPGKCSQGPSRSLGVTPGTIRDLRSRRPRRGRRSCRARRHVRRLPRLHQDLRSPGARCQRGGPLGGRRGDAAARPLGSGSGVHARHSVVRRCVRRTRVMVRLACRPVGEPYRSRRSAPRRSGRPASPTRSAGS